MQSLPSGPPAGPAPCDFFTLSEFGELFWGDRDCTAREKARRRSKLFDALTELYCSVDFESDVQHVIDTAEKQLRLDDDQSEEVTLPLPFYDRIAMLEHQKVFLSFFSASPATVTLSQVVQMRQLVREPTEETPPKLIKLYFVFTKLADRMDSEGQIATADFELFYLTGEACRSFAIGLMTETEAMLEQINRVWQNEYDRISERLRRLKARS